MTPMKTNRGLISYILLTIVTCGIYPIYFLWKLAKDVNVICKEDGKKTAGLLAYILLTAVTCGIYSIIWWFKLCERLHDNGVRRNLPVDISGAGYLLWCILGSLLCGLGPLIATHKIFKGVNILAADYNARMAAQNMAQ